MQSLFVTRLSQTRSHSFRRLGENVSSLIRQIVRLPRKIWSFRHIFTYQRLFSPLPAIISPLLGASKRPENLSRA